MSNHLIHRRLALRQGVSTFIALAVIPIISLPRNAYAGAASKSDMHYQNTPRDGNHCSDCSAFLPSMGGKNSDGSCKIVAGPVSPQGWCVAFSPKT